MYFRIKNDILPPAILGLTLLIALIFVFGSAGRAIGNLRTDRENQLSTEEAKANAYHDDVEPFFDVIRASADELEFIVDNEIWPLPKYRELLFTK